MAAAVVAVEKHADDAPAALENAVGLDALEVGVDVVAAVGGGSGAVEEHVAADAADVTEKIRQLEMRVEEASSIDQPGQHACLLRYVVPQSRLPQLY